MAVAFDPFRLRACFSTALLLCFITVQAQKIAGILHFPAPDPYMVLYGTRGADHPALDTASIGPDGNFSFPLRSYPPGFYQLGVNDSDRVDIILDPREQAFEVAFAGKPLQRNIRIVRSVENERMWSYKQRSRAGQVVLAEIRGLRETASPRDTALLAQLIERESATRRSLELALDSLVKIDPAGQFAFAVNADKQLQAAVSNGPKAIRQAFDFSDARLLRSAAYTKALINVLQSSPVVDEFSFHRACDTLLQAASGDTATWSYTRKHLIDIFATYGPDDVAQYLVERYVLGTGALLPPDQELLQLAAQQLRIAPGAVAPDMILVVPSDPDTLRLKNVVPKHEFTVLFFYSSTCDHCHDQMPGLRQLVLDMDPAFMHVIGIALDATVEEFNETLVNEQINWPCYSELKGWGVEGAKDFSVKATPSFVVVDKLGKIAAKPMDNVELRTFLEQRRP